jgi:hypothetical protein
MTNSPETPAFSAEAFDENFFAAYEEELTDINPEEQALLALADILTIEQADGTQKTYEQLRYETQAFFANDWVRNDEVMMNRLAMEFAQACISHMHGGELSQGGQLGSMFKKGIGGLFGDAQDHNHDHDHDLDDDDDEIDPATGRKKKRSGQLGRLATRK